MTNKEKALKLINEYLAKQEPQKVELGFIDDVKKITSNLEGDWKNALNIAVNGAKELENKVMAEIKPLNQQIQSLKQGIDKSEQLLKELGIGKNSDILKAKKELKIAEGQVRELSEIAKRLRGIY
jgi:peptidoglycan hydrolase CwlO-like protein